MVTALAITIKPRAVVDEALDHIKRRKEHKKLASDEYEVKLPYPELRKKLLEEIKQYDKGGEPGQGPGRKAQLLTQEYEKQGGYKGQKDESQVSLEQRTE